MNERPCEIEWTLAPAFTSRLETSTAKNKQHYRPAKQPQKKLKCEYFGNTEVSRHEDISLHFTISLSTRHSRYLSSSDVLGKPLSGNKDCGGSNCGITCASQSNVRLVSKNDHQVGIPSHYDNKLTSFNKGFRDRWEGKSQGKKNVHQKNQAILTFAKHHRT